MYKHHCISGMDTDGLHRPPIICSLLNAALLPTVTGIIRGPAGRQVWSLQMRQHPRSDKVRSPRINITKDNCIVIK